MTLGSFWFNAQLRHCLYGLSPYFLSGELCCILYLSHLGFYSVSTESRQGTDWVASLGSQTQRSVLHTPSPIRGDTKYINVRRSRAKLFVLMVLF